MKTFKIALYSLTLSFALQTMADTLSYKDKKLIFKDKQLSYQASNLNFMVPVSKCRSSEIKSYFKKFNSSEKNKLDLLKEKKWPVSYQLNGKSLTTHQGSKIHSELDSIGKKIMLLKFKVEKKC